ncbi:MAG: hypothetical protein AAGG56_12880 [Pseudomonadota bacterium]
MCDSGNENNEHQECPAAEPQDEADRLLAKYGHLLDAEMPGDVRMTAAQRKEFLLALWKIMQAFVDVGFSVAPGDKFHVKCDLGMDDMLNYLVRMETPEGAVADQPNDKNNKETP